MSDVKLHPFGYAPERCPKCGQAIGLEYPRTWYGEGRFIGADYCAPHVACYCVCGWYWRTRAADDATSTPETT